MYINITELLQLKSRMEGIHSNLKNNLSGVATEITAINGNLLSSNLTRANNNMLEKVSDLSSAIEVNLAKLIEFLGTQIEKYKVTNEQAKEELAGLVDLISGTFDASGAVLANAAVFTASTGGIASGTETVAPPVVAEALDLSVYSNKPEKGFTVTTGNPTFELSDKDRDFMYGIVAAECDKSYDDALAVSSVILNRCSTPQWVNWVQNGTSPVAQMQKKGQFSVYSSGAYLKYTGGNAPDAVKKAVDDALNGVRNCSYLSFRSNGSVAYGSNMITDRGNRYQ